MKARLRGESSMTGSLSTSLDQTGRRSAMAVIDTPSRPCRGSSSRLRLISPRDAVMRTRSSAPTWITKHRCAASAVQARSTIRSRIAPGSRDSAMARATSACAPAAAVPTTPRSSCVTACGPLAEPAAHRAPLCWDSRLVFAPAERSTALCGEARLYGAEQGHLLGAATSSEVDGNNDEILECASPEQRPVVSANTNRLSAQELEESIELVDRRLLASSDTKASVSAINSWRGRPLCIYAS